MQNQSTWYCSLCLINLFPFKNLEDETDFMAAINKSPSNGSLRYLSDKIFLPFELNDNYFVESSFNSGITKTFDKKQNFCLCHMNIRSIRKNLGSFEITLENLQHKFSLIGITETWLKDDDCDLYAIQCYNVVEKHRQTRSGGGVAIFIKDNIGYTVRSDPSTFNEHIESVFIEINNEELTINRNIVIRVIYRTPNTNIKDFNAQIASVLEELCIDKKHVYLMGDYNIDLLNSESHDLTNEFVYLMCYCHR